MDEDIVIIIAASVSGLAAMGAILTGLKMWLKARAHRLGGAVREEPDDLRAAIAQLRSEVEHACGEPARRPAGAARADRLRRATPEPRERSPDL